MAISHGQLGKLLPELYPIIGNHLPLHATAPTLLSLALTNRYNADVVLPILNSRLILKSNEEAIPVLRRLRNDPTFGPLVRELYVMFHELDGSQPHNPSLDVLFWVQYIVSAGRLPYIHTLEMNFLYGWDPFNPRYYSKYGHLDFYRFCKGFFICLTEKCPRLTNIILRGLQDVDQWIQRSGLFYVPLDIPSLRTLSLRMHGGSDCGFGNLLRNLSVHAQYLHTLELALPIQFTMAIPVTDILKLTFPSLTKLSLGCFETVDTATSMDFFKRHPSISYLNIAQYFGPHPWFTPELPLGFLPNLLHLEVMWRQAELLAPLFAQLVTLCILSVGDSSEIPPLSRIVSTPLPRLKGLEIGQAPWKKVHDQSEDAHATDTRTVNKESNLQSIFRVAPNLEELGFHSAHMELSKICSLSDDLNRFTRLKHLYYIGYGYIDDIDESEREIFSGQVMGLAKAVRGLLSVTQGSCKDLPYLTARIRRSEDGSVDDIVIGKGFGMKVGREDVAFPRTPYDFGGRLDNDLSG